MVLVTPGTWPPGTGHRRQRDTAGPAAIRSDERVPPGVDVGATHPVGHDDGPACLGDVPPAHVTEFRRNGANPGNSAARATRYGVRGRPCQRLVGTRAGPTGSSVAPYPWRATCTAAARVPEELVHLSSPSAGTGGGASKPKCATGRRRVSTLLGSASQVVTEPLQLAGEPVDLSLLRV